MEWDNVIANRFRPGDIVQHFKREMLGEDADENMYTYRVIGPAMHTETEETLVISQALYGDRRVFARPLDSFVSEVDRGKYPEIKQKYRFEVIERSGLE